MICVGRQTCSCSSRFSFLACSSSYRSQILFCCGMLTHRTSATQSIRKCLFCLLSERRRSGWPANAVRNFRHMQYHCCSSPYHYFRSQCWKCLRGSEIGSSMVGQAGRPLWLPFGPYCLSDRSPSNRTCGLGESDLNEWRLQPMLLALAAELIE